MKREVSPHDTRTHILVPYSPVRAKGVSRDNHDGEHDYYDTAWGLHEDPLVGFWLPTPQSPAGNDISRDSVEGAPARACPLQSELSSLARFSNSAVTFALDFSTTVSVFARNTCCVPSGGAEKRVYTHGGREGRNEIDVDTVQTSVYPELFWSVLLLVDSGGPSRRKRFLKTFTHWRKSEEVTQRAIIMGEKTFNLTWNNHLANLSGLFEGLYKSGSLTDTTLACQGGMLRAHRLVLAACSPYFERVFKEHYGEQPILILKGVAVEEMECLLDFMYRGSIDVAEEHLPSLIKTATDLEVRGLSGDQRNQESTRSPYTRVETRMQWRHIETRVHTTEYMKEPSVIPFLPKQSSVESLEDHIKVEEIEVEDDPMVIDGHEESFDEPVRTSETQIRRMPPPMYKRETRFKGQKRVSVGRPSRSTESQEYKSKERATLKEDSARDDNYEDSSSASKFDSSYNGSTDPTVPDVEMNEDLQERAESLDSSKSADESSRLTMKKKSDGPSKRTSLHDGKESTRPILAKSDRAQYKPFSCDLCTLAFTRASHLARHRRVHTGERPFACSICPRMFARQDKLKQHVDSHMQWPKRKSSLSSTSCQPTISPPTKGKRGRPRKVNLEQSAMEEILKFGEFSSLLNKSHSANSTVKSEDFTMDDKEEKVEGRKKVVDEQMDEDKEKDTDTDTDKDKDNYGDQSGNGQDDSV